MERILFLLFSGSLIWAPLPFASQRPWAATLLCTLIFILVAIWSALYSLGRVKINTHVWQHAKRPLWVLLALQCWVFFQCIPLPYSVVSFLSPHAASLYDAKGWVPLSLDVFATKLYVIKGFCLAGAFGLTLVLVNSQKRVKTVLFVLFGSGVFQAVYGAFMVLSGFEYGFFVNKYVGLGAATGTFVNSNHYAGYLIMTAFIGVGCLLVGKNNIKAKGFSSQLVKWAHYLISPDALIRVCLCLMIVALLLSRSRSGNMIFFAALVVLVSYMMWMSKKINWRLITFILSFIVVDVLIVGRWFGFEEVAQRLAATNLQEEDRGSIAKMSIKLGFDYAITGVGGGAFDVVFPGYKTPQYDLRYQHAHNDYLEFWVELGLVGIVLLGWFCLLILSAIHRVLRQRHSTVYRSVALAGVGVWAWIALHSLTDFNMQIFANAFTVIIICGLIAVSEKLPRGYKR